MERGARTGRAVRSQLRALLTVVLSAALLTACATTQPPSSPPATGTRATTPTSPQPTNPTTRPSPATTPTRSPSTTTATTPRTGSTTPRPSTAAPVRAGQPAWVAVSVATLWSTPSSPRAVDAPALRAPADVRGWLAAMTLADRRGLQGRAETQSLLGDRLLVTAVSGSWASVLAPDQPTPKDARGYPGWVPVRQLSAVAPRSGTQAATVVARTAWLRGDTAAAARVVEVSFGTRLPVLGTAGGLVRVALPGGVVRRVDPTAVVRTSTDGRALPATGASVVASARGFTGLPYLWAGRSGFGFDCSGLTSLVYRVHGVRIPRDADAQALAGRRVASTSMVPGDLLFYATSSGYVHHVSMYAGSGLMVQSPATGQSVQIIPVATPAYAVQQAGARRYLP
ncbi:MAG TPA: NlpC/P60 family protein [Pedococcus sp.]|nr:NlpC/P60 family protein [Pedococcus sp.]